MKRVLIIDDAQTVRMYHRQLVESAGHEVIEAENGVEALEQMAQTEVDLMLVDVNMPQMDGYRCLRHVRESDDYRCVPAIMISTEAQQRDLDQARAAGASFYIVKPTDPDRLVRMVEVLLDCPALADDTSVKDASAQGASA